jgi:NAD(P)-dependent dehydrogenase (short-subunit alcohol dehydrogenase family)
MIYVAIRASFNRCSPVAAYGWIAQYTTRGAAKSITVNTLAPGYIATDMVIAVPKVVLDTKIIPLTPVGRPGTPEEIARRVDFLAADRREITDKTGEWQGWWRDHNGAGLQVKASAD